MNTQFDNSVRVSLNKAAQEDVYMLDLSSIAKGAADHVHAMIGETLKIAQKRFDAHMKAVPAHLHAAAIEYICDKGDEIINERTHRAIRGAKQQRAMREARLAKEALAAA